MPITRSIGCDFTNPTNKDTTMQTNDDAAFDAMMNANRPAPAPAQKLTPSKYQAGVYDWIRTGEGHAIINAVAGSGKTTTLIEAINHCYETAPGRILFLAFNKHIADTLRGKIPFGIGATASTFNAFGWGICRDNVPGVKLDKFKDESILRKIVDPGMDKARFSRLRNPVLRMTSLLKSLNRTTAQWQSSAEEYGIELGDLKPMDKFDQVLAEVFRRSVQDIRVMNFDDQLFQPIFRGWNVPSYRWVLIDESQDASPVQIELAKQLAEHGRMILVGDPDQSIYLFRGAHPDAMATLRDDLDAVELPLSVCYRCPSLVIESAKKQVPRIEEPQPNPKGEGVVEWVTTPQFLKDARGGDLVLCRTTAPLVKRCLQFIREDRKAYVRGRDLGQGLVKLIEQIHGNESTLQSDYFALFTQNARPGEPDVPAFLEQVKDYYKVQSARLESQSREAELIALDDRITTIQALAEGCDFTVELIKRIEGIFSDDDQIDAINLMTIHRAKGLEVDRVWILRLDLMPHPKSKKEHTKRQERNLLYVAKTRAMKELRFVKKEDDEK